MDTFHEKRLGEDRITNEHDMIE